jgi:hypothetical protein
VDNDRDYLELVNALSESQPLLAQDLRVAEERRRQRLSSYLGGMRLPGLEQLQAFLIAATESYKSIRSLERLAFLVERVRVDISTALEATLSGYQGVAADAMRDVMEIEGLLLDFAANPENVDEWLEADRKTLIGKYGPGAVRDRLKTAGVAPYANEGFEPIDYRAHSQALHVTPVRAELSGRGLEPYSATSSIFSDLGFIEMFEHGSRVVRAIEMLRLMRLERPWPEEPLAPHDAFDAAYERTREMQVIVIAFLQAPSLLAARLGRDPKPSEILHYVADEVREKSPRRDDGASGS